MLVLGVPVFPRPLWLMRLNKFKGSLAFEHINFFTKETLSETVRRAGWEIVTARPFIFFNQILDKLAAWVAPQAYVIARKIPNFVYPGLRLAEAQHKLDTLYF